MSAPGWYPDPGGQPGLFRYWNGAQWTPSVTTNPAGTPAPGGTAATPAGEPEGGQKPRKVGAGLLIGAGVGVLVLGLVIWLVFQGIGRLTGSSGTAGGNATANTCPTTTSTALPTTPTQQSSDRVYGGSLSYPMLGSPWGSVQADDRVPFGRDIASQTVTVEANYAGDGSSNWVASVLIGELVAGDGFFTPEEGAEIVMKCVVGAFYGNAEVGREDQESKATTVDGHEAWIIQSHLSFDIEGLQTKGELAVIVVIRINDEKSGLFYASIPDTTPELVSDAETALAGLTVDD